MHWCSWQSDKDEIAILSYLQEREWAHLYLAGFMYKAVKDPSLRKHILLAYLEPEQKLLGVVALDMDKRLLVDSIDDLSPYYPQVETFLGKWPKPYCLIGYPPSLYWLESYYGQGENFIAIDYSLMTLPWSKMGAVTYMNPQAIVFRRTSQDDYRKLLPLEIGYQKEEVMVAKQHIMSESSIAAYFKRRLQKEANFHLEYKEHALAKVSINVEGIYFDQVAGVYTDPSLRRRGLAKILFGHLLTYYYRHQRRGLALFVKTHNQEAIGLYSSLGFSHQQYFRISYL